MYGEMGCIGRTDMDGGEEEDKEGAEDEEEKKGAEDGAVKDASEELCWQD